MKLLRIIHASRYLFLAHIILSAIHATGQTREKGPWWPSPLWGAADQSGASNWITPEKILQAVSLVKTGKYCELGHVYEAGMPLPDKRNFKLIIPSFPTYSPTGKDSLVFNDEYVTSEIGQVGTQFDGPGHPGRHIRMADGRLDNIFYNGFTEDEMRNPYGLLKLGVENVKPIITRGILIDLATYKDVNTMPENYAITVTDIRNALEREGIKESDIEPGDALLFNLGWWRLWPDKKTIDGKAAYASPEAIDWIISKKPSIVGSDAHLDSAPDFSLHRRLIIENGIFNVEFLNFESISQGISSYKFLFILTPLRLKGATGSPCRPLAIF